MFAAFAAKRTRTLVLVITITRFALVYIFAQIVTLVLIGGLGTGHFLILIVVVLTTVRGGTLLVVTRISLTGFAIINTLAHTLTLVLVSLARAGQNGRGLDGLCGLGGGLGAVLVLAAV